MIGGISTDSVLIWAQQHAEAIGEQLKTEMSLSKQRLAEVDALNKLKSLVADAKNHTSALGGAQTEIHDMLAKYPDLELQLGRMSADLDFEVSKYTNNGTTGFRDYIFGDDGRSGEKEAIADYVSPNGKWGSAIDGAIDSLQHEDSLQMINIQNLASKLDQADRLGSNLIAVLNDANKSVISNIRA
jgi:hypothetical protein